MIKAFINMVSGFLEFLANESIKLVLTVFAWFGKLGGIVLDMPVVTTGILYTQELALSILSLKVAYEAYMIYIIRQSGEPTSDPSDLLIGAIRAASVISVMPWLVKYIYQFGISASFEVSALPGVGYDNVNNSTFTALTNLLNQAGSALIFIAVAIIFALVMLILVIIQSFIRASELAGQAWMGSIMALSLTSRDSQGWTSWWKDMLVITFATAYQIAMLKFSFYTLTPIEVNVNGQMTVVPAMINLLLFIAALWVTYKSPIALKEKLQSTGIGRAGGAAVQTAVQSKMMRAIMRK